MEGLEVGGEQGGLGRLGGKGGELRPCEGDVQLEPPDTEGRGDSEEVKCVALTEANELGVLQAAIQEAGHACSGQLVNVPLTTVDCSEEDEELNYKVIDRLDEIDDVSSVEHNMAVATPTPA